MGEHSFNFNRILLTNLNNYPINIFIHGLGAIGWTVAGLITKDRALMTNFGLQIQFLLWVIFIGYLILQLDNQLNISKQTAEKTLGTKRNLHYMALGCLLYQILKGDR